MNNLNYIGSSIFLIDLGMFIYLFDYLFIQRFSFEIEKHLPK